MKAFLFLVALSGVTVTGNMPPDNVLRAAKGFGVSYCGEMGRKLKDITIDCKNDTQMCKVTSITCTDA